jgi:hypothetical protein
VLSGTPASARFVQNGMPRTVEPEN